jgi:SAM-dependent methyltransferase
VGPSSLTPLGRALLDHHEGARAATLRVHSDVAEPEELPVSLFFRRGDELLPCDVAALAPCRGSVLDVGAGAGAVSLAVAARGLAVTSIDPLAEAVRVMRARGVPDPRRSTLAAFRPGRPFDTVLALMNGAGLAGTLGGLRALLRDVASLLAPGGQLLMDSTDPRSIRGVADPFLEDGRYVGEVHFQMEYLGEKGPPFPYLFVDREPSESPYLARLVR